MQGMPVWSMREVPALQGNPFCLDSATFLSQGDFSCLGPDLSQHDCSSGSSEIVEEVSGRDLWWSLVQPPVYSVTVTSNGQVIVAENP